MELKVSAGAEQPIKAGGLGPFRNSFSNMPLLPNPGLVHLISTNAAPLPPETQQIQNEIDILTETFDKLRSQLQQVEEQRQSYRSLLSAVRRIPPEVLAEIFIFTPE